jgi:glycerol uptake facilitator-like aquaporin
VLLGEAVATAGLVLVVRGLVRSGREGLLGVLVPAYVGAGIWFTSSGAFANPAVTLARALIGGPTGVAPGSLPGLLAAQLLGTAAGAALAAWFFPRPGGGVAGVTVRTAEGDSSGIEQEELHAEIRVSYCC